MYAILSLKYMYIHVVYASNPGWFSHVHVPILFLGNPPQITDIVADMCEEEEMLPSSTEKRKIAENPPSSTKKRKIAENPPPSTKKGKKAENLPSSTKMGKIAENPPPSTEKADLLSLLTTSTYSITYIIISILPACSWTIPSSS